MTSVTLLNLNQRGNTICITHSYQRLRRQGSPQEQVSGRQSWRSTSSQPLRPSRPVLHWEPSSPLVQVGQVTACRGINIQHWCVNLHSKICRFNSGTTAENFLVLLYCCKLYIQVLTAVISSLHSPCPFWSLVTSARSSMIDTTSPALNIGTFTCRKSAAA